MKACLFSKVTVFVLAVVGAVKVVAATLSFPLAWAGLIGTLAVLASLMSIVEVFVPRSRAWFHPPK